MRNFFGHMSDAWLSFDMAKLRGWLQPCQSGVVNRVIASSAGLIDGRTVSIRLHAVARCVRPTLLGVGLERASLLAPRL